MTTETAAAENKWTTFFTELLQSAGSKIFFAALMLFVGLWIAKLIPKLIAKSKGFRKLDATLGDFLLSLTKLVLYTSVIVSSAIILGVPTTSFLTVLASAGVAVGLALQGSLANFAGGIMLLAFKPFRVGDYIEGSGVAGTVTDINIFYTILTTLDNKKITVPNGSLSNGSVTNFSANPTRRSDLVFSVAYESDIDAVRAVMLKAANDSPYVLDDPAPEVLMSAHAASALEFTLRVWTKKEDFLSVKFELRESVKKLFDKYGIRIPFDQIDVHLDK